MTKPFKSSFENYKKFRLCQNQDYERLEVKNYVEDIKNLTG